MENEKLTYINSRGERLELGVDSVYHCNISKDVEGIFSGGADSGRLLVRWGGLRRSCRGLQPLPVVCQYVHWRSWGV